MTDRHQLTNAASEELNSSQAEFNELLAQDLSPVEEALAVKMEESLNELRAKAGAIRLGLANHAEITGRGNFYMEFLPLWEFGAVRESLTLMRFLFLRAHDDEYVIDPRIIQLVRVLEREDISRGIASGSSIRGIAKGLKRAVSTVSREVARHGGRPLYRASEADHQAWESALRPKTCLLADHEQLQTMVASKLLLDWSPE